MSQASSVEPTVSIRPYLNEASGTYSVELFVHGLRTEASAEKLADMLTAFIAGDELKSH